MKEEIENPYVHAYGYGTDNYDRAQEGITLRDELAKTAMLGLLSHYGMEGTHKVLSETSYSIADNMLKQRLVWHIFQDHLPLDMTTKEKLKTSLLCSMQLKNY